MVAGGWPGIKALAPAAGPRVAAVADGGSDARAAPVGRRAPPPGRRPGSGAAAGLLESAHPVPEP